MNSCKCFLLYVISFSIVLTSFLHLGLVPAAASSILINCGTQGNMTDDYKRTWIGDTGLQNLSFLDTLALTPDYGIIGLPDIPYNTSRIFVKAFTYSIPVPPERSFLRLHFFPVGYGSFLAENAVFNVAVGPYTLLNNFSTYEALQQKLQQQILDLQSLDLTIISEFSLNLSSSGFLNITFTPTYSSSSNSYAFISGIEIVPMPDIFVTSQPPQLIRPVKDFRIDPDAALETMYRLNVGGQHISPPEDSGGLYRTWDNDTVFMPVGDGSGVVISKDTNVTVRYPRTIPDYIAPTSVYESARTMPMDSPNVNSNLTWSFVVDPGFHYLFRFHFCEVNYPFTTTNQRVFTIYIGNQIAENQVDVIAYSRGIGIPVFRDYIVFMPNGTEQTDLLVALHPNIDSRPEYANVILNALEIFKLGQGDGNLAGLRPRPLLLDSSRKSKRAAAIGGGVGGSAALLMIGLLAYILYSRVRRVAKHSAQQGTISSSLPANLCSHFSFAEIENATNNFDQSRLLGVGGFGKVYCGLTDGGSNKVAIKRANPMSEQGFNEFRTEIEMLSKLRHRHLVSLIGYCEENHEMILLYDYMANGTLREHLYGTQKPHLTWEQRLEICIGAARGLHYLHTGARHTIIHRDVKTTNILLDEKWVAKVSDFGLSKVTSQVDHTHVSTIVKGSFGYLDPEYFRRQKLTSKSDVYSFGVVLLEVLCARPPLSHQLSDDQVSLVEWALHCHKTGTLDQIIDPHLKDSIAPECLTVFVETAEKCLDDHGVNRPTMGDVLWNLESALQLQGSNKQDKRPNVQNSGSEGPLLLSKKENSMGSTSMSIEGQGLVFSHIQNVEGR